MALRVISSEELKEHTQDDNGWMAINGVVWDISGFAAEHPGGEEVIQEYLGQDASEIYNSVHGPGTISQHLGPEKKIGLAEAKTEDSTDEKTGSDSETRTPLELILSMNDFEEAAHKYLPEGSLAYCAGATNDGISNNENRDFYQRIMFRPRLLRDVSHCDTSTTIFNTKFPFPFFNAPASLAKVVHPDGELAIARGSAAKGSTMMIPCMSSFTLDEIVECLPPAHPFFFQVYVHEDRSISEKMIRHAASLKPKAMLITIDLPTFSKRETKERYDAKIALANPKKTTTGQNQARQVGRSISPKLNWADIAWLKSITDIPIVLKGIQCAEDAKMALQHGCSGIYLSNHGGRALDTSPPGILTLLEIQAECPEILEKMEVFIDGGIRRGTDILKAICLGASAVCLGRPFLYAAMYGQEGVEHAIKILDEELQSAMTLVGITSLDQAHPGLLNTTALDPYVCRGTEHPWAKRIVRSRL